MCTVSYYKNKDQVIITSNRDEHINRPNALAPQKIMLENTAVYCPIDPLRNGTWFAVNQSGGVFVLLNGADQKHIPMPPYKKSRGLIVLEMVGCGDYIEKWNNLDLNQIENFTLVVFESNRLFQFQWNGNEKSQIELENSKPYIWSSTTLYAEETIANRKKWFFDYLTSKDNNVSANDLLRFHTNTKKEDKHNGLIINRNHEMMTKNVTQVVLFTNRFILEHHDLLTNNNSLTEVQFHENLVA